MGEKVQDVLKDISIPFYILQGDADEISDQEGALLAYKKISTREKFKNLNILRDLKHDLLHEDCHLAIMEEIIEFIKKIQSNM